jgi:hypothetical protein
MFNVIAKNGELDFGSDYNLARFSQWLKEREGKRIRIEQLISSRTTLQNNYYWLYLGVIERETGNNANDLHEYFKRKFLVPEFKKVVIKGKPVEYKCPKSTTKLNKIEFGDYLDKICSETDVPLPDPVEAGYLPH